MRVVAEADAVRRAKGKTPAREMVTAQGLHRGPGAGACTKVPQELGSSLRLLENGGKATGRASPRPAVVDSMRGGSEARNATRYRRAEGRPSAVEHVGDGIGVFFW